MSSFTPLCEIMVKNGSDKGGKNRPWHNYTTFYYSLFNHDKERYLRVFELGLGTNNTSIPSNMGVNGIPGASLRGWVDFFPNALVYGADIDKDILFNTERIKTFYCDQTDTNSISELWSQKELLTNFDLILEDGLHTFEANVCFFENSIHKLNDNGFFIIEDINTSNVERMREKCREWTSKFNVDAKVYMIEHTYNNCDNNIVVIHKRGHL